MLIIGASGFLGRVLCDFPVKGWDRVGASRAGGAHLVVDLTRSDQIEAAVHAVRPKWVINAAAMTSVDGCERDPETARAVHIDGTRHLVRACEEAGCGLVTLSTNYVFDGAKELYGESDMPNPLNVYGRTKLASEAIVLNAKCPGIVVRTAVLYGYRPGQRLNFVTWAMRALARKEAIQVVTDEWANPTYVDELAAFLFSVCRTDFQGVAHFGGCDFLSRYDMVQRVCTICGYNPQLVTPVTSVDFAQPARRPLRAGLQMDLAQRICDVVPAPFDDHLRKLLEIIPTPAAL